MCSSQLRVAGFSLKRNGFTTIHTYYLQNSKCSFHCYIASYEKCCICRDYLGTDKRTNKQTDRHTDRHTDTQEDYCNPPPMLGLIIIIK